MSSRTFPKYFAGLVEQYRPASTLECELDDDLADLLWRLRRCRAFETNVIRVQQEAKRSGKLSPEAIECEVIREIAAADLVVGEAYQNFDFSSVTGDVQEFKMASDKAWLRLTERQRDLRTKYNAECRFAEERARDGGALTGTPTLCASSFGSGKADAEDGRRAILLDNDCLDTLAKISRYETTLRNSIARALNQLYILQTARRDSQFPRP